MMKTGRLMTIAVLVASLCAADDLQQKYEKAYYLETAKGQPSQAAAIYKTIIDEEVTDQNRETIKKSLLQLLHIATKQKAEGTIRECQEKLLGKTDATIQDLIDIAEPGTTIHIPAGTYTNTLVIGKNLKLQGTDRDTATLEATADRPLIHIQPKLEVEIESLTLKSQLETSQRSDPPGCTVLAADTTATIHDCAFIALGNDQRSPVSVLVQGFSEVQLLECRFQGFEYPMIYSDGSKGLVKGCIVLNPGHSGFISHPGSEVTIDGNIFTGSGFHGVRSTGGTIHLKNNLIINNKNRGVYLGNKSAYGEITNNAIIGNGTGISCFSSTEIEIANNLVLDSAHAGIDTRGSCRIEVRDNIVVGSKKTGFALYEGGDNKFKVGKNTFWNNGTPATDFKLPGSTVEEDPGFSDPEHGHYAVGNSSVRKAKHGLTDPDAIATLWEKYKEAIQWKN
jgi:nitrous oxidase accessory protein NosD